MITLALDTATSRGEVALLHDGSMQAAQAFSRKAGKDNLFPALARLGVAGALSTGSVQLIGVGLGPGSFTGIRAGVAAAAGLALAHQIPIVGVNTFDALALTCLPGMPADVMQMCVLCDARREEVYCAFYDRAGGRRGDIRICPLKTVVERIREPVWFVSWEIDRYVDSLRVGSGGVAVIGPTIHPTAVAVGRLAELRFLAQGRRGDSILEPCYLRPTQYRTVPIGLSDGRVS